MLIRYLAAALVELPVIIDDPPVEDRQGRAVVPGMDRHPRPDLGGDGLGRSQRHRSRANGTVNVVRRAAGSALRDDPIDPHGPGQRGQCGDIADVYTCSIETGSVDSHRLYPHDGHHGVTQPVFPVPEVFLYIAPVVRWMAREPIPAVIDPSGVAVTIRSWTLFL